MNSYMQQVSNDSSNVIMTIAIIAVAAIVIGLMLIAAVFRLDRNVEKIRRLLEIQLQDGDDAARV